MALNFGATFAGYRIIRLLGSGGMGEVYLAEHPRLPRRDAVKILSPAVSADPSFRDRFHREADLAATLFHPHIVGVHDRGESEGHLWIAFDFVDGPDAAGLMRSRYPAGMPPAEALDILRAVASALDYAHCRGLLHRDVKPANILLTDEAPDERRILLADFGIARLLDEISGLTATNTALGTVNYAAPEQLADTGIDSRADQYSLAATAFHLLTGAPPYQHSSPAVTIGRHLNAPPPVPGAMNADLAVFDPAIAVAMAKDPAQRYPSCRHFVDALADASAPDRCDAGSVTMAATPAVIPAAPPALLAPPGTPPAAPVSRRSPLAVVAASLALGLLAGAVVLGNTESPGEGTASSMQTTTVTATSTAVSTKVSTTTMASTTTVRPVPSTTTVTETATATATVAPAPVAPADTPARSGSGSYMGPNLITSSGWDYCTHAYGWSSCLESARDAAGAPYGAPGPLTGDGTWTVPLVVRYGDYRAAVGPTGSCLWYGYDARGRLVDSGIFVRSGAQATASITPTMTTFQSLGCTPWFRVQPLN